MTSGARGTESSSPGAWGRRSIRGAWEPGVRGHSWEGRMAGSGGGAGPRVWGSAGVLGDTGL